VWYFVLQFVVDKRREQPGTVTYSTDLSDQQWALIEPLLPKAKTGGRPRTTDIRRVADAIMYLVKTGCHWRLIPSDFPPWRTVYEYFVQWRATGTLKKIHQILVKKVRRSEGKKLLPTIAIMDCQSVKTGKMVSHDKGYDGGKHVKVRWLRLSEQLRTKDKWIPAGFGWCDALLGCDAGRA